MQPRKVRRNGGGLSDQLRNLLKSAENDKANSKQDDTNDSANVDAETTSPAFEINSMHEYEIESDLPDDAEEETVIYEIIDEI